MAEKPNLAEPMELRAQAVEWALRILAPKGAAVETESVVKTATELEAFIKESKKTTSSAYTQNPDGSFKEIG